MFNFTDTVRFIAGRFDRAAARYCNQNTVQPAYEK